MKTKTINKAVCAKFDAWVQTIEDQNLRSDVRNGTVVTGGCITSMLLNEPVNDFDVYFTSQKLCQDVAEYYVAKFVSETGHPMKVSSEEGRVRIITGSGHRGETAGDVVRLTDPGDIEDTYEELNEAALATEDDDKAEFRPVFMSTNAITLSHKVQIVIRFFGNPDTLHENYDFVHCMNYWTSKDRKIMLRQDALESILTRELRYVGSKYPLCSIIRTRKFIKRGWSINAGQFLKMVMQLNEMDLTNPKILEDQLTGVDSAYFMEVINKLNERDPKKINGAYLIEIIDRMF